MPRPTIVVALALAAAGCEREVRDFRGTPPGAVATSPVVMSELQPGGPTREPATRAPYQENAYAIGEGKHLYTQFNCVGCHAMGGGGMGPPLMDDEWIYGSEPENIRATILEGRPNGMPSFRGRISEDRVWWLVAYVRSMSGLVRLDARPGRADAMHVKPPEVLTERRPPRNERAPARRGGSRP